MRAERTCRGGHDASHNWSLRYRLGPTRRRRRSVAARPVLPAVGRTQLRNVPARLTTRPDRIVGAYCGPRYRAVPRPEATPLVATAGPCLAVSSICARAVPIAVRCQPRAPLKARCSTTSGVGPRANGNTVVHEGRSLGQIAARIPIRRSGRRRTANKREALT